MTFTTCPKGTRTASKGNLPNGSPGARAGSSFPGLQPPPAWLPWSGSACGATPDAAYLEEVGKLYELLADNTGADNGTVDWEAVLHELTEENMPLFDQLPEELSASEKTALLKQYYGGLLNEAGQIRKQLNKENRFLR